MASQARVDLYVEDIAQESIVRSLVVRVFAEAGVEPLVAARSARGGHGRALIELEAFQKAVRAGSLGFTVPDLLVVARDANCSKFAKAYKEVDGKIDRAVFPEAVIACPDPHVERWFMADPPTFKQVVGADVRPGTRKCAQDLYKAKLAGAVARAEIPSTLGGVEFAHDLVNAMDLYRAGKREPSLKHFVSDLAEAARRLALRP